MSDPKHEHRFLASERGLFVTLFVLYLIATSALTLFSFRASRDEQLAQTRSTLLTAARAGGHIIGVYFHDIYDRSHAPGEVHYRLIVESLNRLVEDLPGVEYVYSMDVVDGKAYFIASNETQEDLERHTPSLFYNPYRSAPDLLFEAKSSGEPIFTPVYTNEWGSFRSAFVPTQRSDGTRYIMAADIKVDGTDRLFINSLKISAFTALAGLLPLYPLLWLYRRLQRDREQELERELYYDRITGLPRVALMEHELQDQPGPFSGILINLDEFHAINTLFGYETGNRLLVQVADTISRQLPSGARLFRSQVDEYFVLLESAQPKSSMHLTQQLLDSIFEPIEAEDNRQITVTARAGIALQVPRALDLLNYAREAMDQARKSGKDMQLYTDDMRPQERYKKNLHWLNTVNDAFRQGRVVPWFQPILDTRTGKICHYEALARLIDTDGTIHTPYAFLPAIRKSHLYRQLTTAIIEQSFALFSNRQSSLAINLTRFDLLDHQTMDHLVHSVSQYGMEERVIIEVIESESIDYQDEVLQVLQRCKQAGIRIAIDDFGSGYSNFDQMLKIDADYLKIDGELVRRLHSSSKAQALVAAVISFAHGLGIPMIAEFVEDRQTLEKLKAFGVQYVQGYGVGRPAPADRLDIR
ncbi:bifunctional diguanylate cyclase/phosphodiesterase [Marinobacterium sp. D7]|uniref:bifunctional diguanylate cyclase/phosphodiesterase n=1 Tax=Marinobacterium ramblicola TaxID=2849041 RepID=UPI001C2D833A|nr:bifunctional diguanylate cyclase/phosphodiesterase [Marinobacterium ramblicola]MBV1789802.1 bifunctional diguanylate cyclase/phosphodiesterase [Marinobacterium ramblicola]